MRRNRVTDLTEWYSRYKPTPKQAEFHAKADTHRFNLLCTGVRFGKTFSGARQAFRYIYVKKIQPNLGWLLVPSYKVGQTAANELLTFLEPCIIKKTGSPGKPMTLHLLPPAGYPYPEFIIDVRSAENPNLLRGAKVGFIWMDEARDQSEEVYNISLQRVADTAGHLMFTTTPRGRSNWLYDRVYTRALDGHKDYSYVQASTYDNPYLSREVIEELEKDFPTEFAKQELRGEFVNLTGLVYPEFKRDKHVIPAYEVMTPSQAMARHEPMPRFFMAVDFGYNDLFVCQWIMDWKGTYWVIQEYTTTHRIARDHARAVAASPYTQFCEAMYTDPNNISSRMELAAAMRDLGIKVPVFPAPRDGSGRNKDFDKGIRLARRLIVDNQLYVFSDCINLIKEFGLYHYKDATEDKNSNDKPIDKFNHSMDALRYGLRAWTAYRPAMATMPKTRENTLWLPQAPEPEGRAAYIAEKQSFEAWYLQGED